MLASDKMMTNQKSFSKPVLLQSYLCMDVTDVVRTVFAKLTSTLIMIMITDFNDDGASLCIIITIQDDHNGFADQSRARSQLAPSHARGLHWIPGGTPSAPSLSDVDLIVILIGELIVIFIGDRIVVSIERDPQVFKLTPHSPSQVSWLLELR